MRIFGFFCAINLIKRHKHKIIEISREAGILMVYRRLLKT